jgi:hypothetical protein
MVVLGWLIGVLITCGKFLRHERRCEIPDAANWHVLCA